MSWDLNEAIAYYKSQGAPGDQNAVTNLLREAQQENHGSIPSWLPKVIAEEYGLKESYLLAIIKRFPSLRLADTHCLEICSGPHCGKHSSAAKLADGIGNGTVTVKFTPCMKMCGKGPNIRWDGRLYHHADEELIRSLLREAARKA